jgi:hypothetical protein
MDLEAAIQALTDLQILPVITVSAVLFLASVAYKRFRR